MEIKDLVKAEETIRNWAGKNASIEFKMPETGCLPYFLVKHKKGFSCLVNPERPKEPFGLRFDEHGELEKRIMRLFKDAEK